MNRLMDLGTKVLYSDARHRQSLGQRIYNKGFFDGLLYGLIFYFLLTIALPPLVSWIKNSGLFPIEKPVLKPARHTVEKIITFKR